MHMIQNKIESIESGNKHLDNLVKLFLNKFEDRIAQFRLVGNKILLSLRVGKKNNRQQTITIGIIQVPDEPFLINSNNTGALILSRIGKITTDGDMHEILRYGFGIHHSGIVMEDDFTVCLKHTIDEIEDLSLSKFSMILLEMAHHADVMEEILFQQDIH